jgi:hypothetical protein
VIDLVESRYYQLFKRMVGLQDGGCCILELSCNRLIPMLSIYIHGF